MSRPIREANPDPHRHFGGFGGYHGYGGYAGYGGYGGYGGFGGFPIGGFGGSHSSAQAGAISSPFGSAAFASSKTGYAFFFHTFHIYIFFCGIFFSNYFLRYLQRLWTMSSCLGFDLG